MAEKEASNEVTLSPEAAAPDAEGDAEAAAEAADDAAGEADAGAVVAAPLHPVATITDDATAAKNLARVFT